MTNQANLIELQQQFLAALTHNNRKFLRKIAGENQQSRQDRLKIYQNGYFYRLYNALIENLPHLATSIPDNIFEKIAHEYIMQYPSTNYTIQTYGNRLPEFLTASPDNFPTYLTEIAALDLALIKASRSSNQPSLCLTDLQLLAQEDWPQLKLVLSTHVSLLKFSYNIPMLWEQNNLGQITPQKLETSQIMLIWRKEITNHYRILNNIEAESLEWLIDNSTITFTIFCEKLAIIDQDPVTTATRLLNQWLADGILLYSTSE